MPISFPPILVNQAGETTLDIAERLKATQCEDLVSKHGHGVFPKTSTASKCPSQKLELERKEAGSLFLNIGYRNSDKHCGYL